MAERTVRLSLTGAVFAREDGSMSEYSCARPNIPAKLEKTSDLHEDASRRRLHHMQDHKTVQVVVAMRAKCWCGYDTDEEFLLDIPHDQAQPSEGFEPSKCPDCGGLIRVHVKRTSALH